MQNMDFWFFCDILRQKWNIILLFACLVALGTGVYSKLFITPIYRSSVSLYLGRVTEGSQLERAIESHGIGGGLGDTTAQLALGSQLNGDYHELINFDVITEGVEDELAKLGKWQKTFYRVSTDQLNASRIIRINIDSSDPLYSQEVATIYAREFINKVQQLVGIQNTQIIEEPALGLKPISPKIIRNILVSFAVGFILAFAFFIALRTVDRTIRTTDDVENILQVPVIGAVHKDKEFTLDKNSPLLFDGNSAENRAQVTEDFRVFRVNLINRKLKDQKEGSVIAITSSQAKEGKTFCTANLGAALAEAGYKVLLIDCDPGKRSLQAYLGRTNENGLMNILSDETDFDHAVKRNMNNLRNMDVLFCGKNEVNSANLMMSPGFKRLIEKVKKEYDYAFLDVSCNLGTADIVSAGSSADSVLLLVRAGKTEGAQAKQTVDALKRANLNISGVIMNGVEDR